MSRATSIVPRLIWSLRSRALPELRLLKYRLDSRYLRNRRSAHLFRSHRPTLSLSQQQTAAELTNRGIAFPSYDDIALPADRWARLAAVVDDFAASDRVREAIRGFRAVAATGEMASDAYIVKLLPPAPTLRLDHPLLEVGLSPAVLNVVNSYLGMWAKLIYTDAWHTIPVDIGMRIGSQYWHRDPEDQRMVKVYAYFGPVGEGCGAMEYVLESQGAGRYSGPWRWKPHAGRGHRYPGDAEVEQAVPPEQRIPCFGNRGTFVFCDTAGLHRGGVATTRPRILATWTFVTPASIGFTAGRRFTIEGDAAASETLAARFALT
jgi:hypothetical protein